MTMLKLRDNLTLKSKLFGSKINLSYGLVSFQKERTSMVTYSFHKNLINENKNKLSEN